MISRTPHHTDPRLGDHVTWTDEDGAVHTGVLDSVLNGTIAYVRARFGHPGVEMVPLDRLRKRPKSSPTPPGPRGTPLQRLTAPWATSITALRIVRDFGLTNAELAGRAPAVRDLYAELELRGFIRQDAGRYVLTEDAEEVIDG